MLGERVGLLGARDVSGAGDRLVSRVGDGGRKRRSVADRDDRVVRAGQDERRGRDRLEPSGEVSVGERFAATCVPLGRRAGELLAEAVDELRQARRS